MRFFTLIFTALMIGLVQAQEDVHRRNLGFFSTIDANVGLDLAAMIKTSQSSNQNEARQNNPGKLSYGFNTQVGYQPWRWMALAGGFRYSYITPNYHLVYCSVQPYFILNNTMDDDFLFLSAKVGKQVNQTVVNNSEFYGLSIGKIEPMGNRIGQLYSLSLETQIIGGDSTFFVGLAYGLTFFSKSRY